LEVMIVVVIVGLLMSAVIPMVSKSSDDVLKEQADRFLALVNLAQDEAILQSRQLGLTVTDKTYSFLQQLDEEDEWVAFDEGPFRKRKLSERTKGALILDDLGVSFEPLDKRKKGKLKPQIFILSSGEMTPFIYEFTFPQGGRIKVSFNAIGKGKQELFSAEK
ncbi:MAG: type II secretion system minor pseudopilin GspH, partial [Cocleimonas sp.]|nr:type II secretion system minor pseudopilin GspH [Cocleimonas sp.]